jgi:hypothetical protein
VVQLLVAVIEVGFSDGCLQERRSTISAWFAYMRKVAGKHGSERTTRGPTRSHASRSAKLAKKLLVSNDLPQQTLQAILRAILAKAIVIVSSL